jgi:cbb3-type cytochrome oxidase maturation protein
MIAMSYNAALLAMWVIFTVLALAGVIAVFVWAVRARQFSDQDRARYLALDSGIPDDPEPSPDRTDKG